MPSGEKATPFLSSVQGDDEFVGRIMQQRKTYFADITARIHRLERHLVYKKGGEIRSTGIRWNNAVIPEVNSRIRHTLVIDDLSSIRESLRKSGFPVL